MRARSSDAVLADVIAATEAPPTVVRSWLMRGTLHMVPADDLRWLVSLFGPVIEARFRRRHAELGLTPDLLHRIADAVPTVLAGTALTRAELTRALIDVGVPAPTSGQGPAHLTLWASVRGLICRGPEIGAEPTYVLLDEWLAGTPEPTAVAPLDERDADPDRAVVDLARRYFQAFGPASVADMAAWSRLSVGRIRAAVTALAGELRVWPIEGHEHYLIDNAAMDHTATDVLRLLPAFDSYVMGYQRRHWFLDPARHTDILEGGMIYPMIVLDGRIIGTWRLDRAGRTAAVEAEFFQPVRPRVVKALHDEVADVGRFLDRDCSLRVVDRISRRPRRPSPAVLA